ncbi:hypothetical protein [Spiroplasma eriocheiris]|uniref:Uncharacterized protein n=1 Tax=Spiroplasma eriocheiris TaxID=315358 RepID=A0A0H3XME5_9MOLU|nr:hypothetical protein [Spiroplasma eriocheiris]AHF57628.1 hypothetical protein SPE_0500 [Spiroplasma eriocheiris CCTCC M 207170]AKM54082.1 hypothetical protein SERIO_v1c05070 [Spiroplasma eriocheiris]
MENTEKFRRQTADYIIKIIRLKTIDFKLANPNISEADVANYFLKVILAYKKVIDVSDSAYYIFNIKMNRIIEFMNNEKIINQDVKLDDFKDMFTSKKG